MLKRFPLLLASALSLALFAFAPLALAQSGPVFEIPYFRVNGSSETKFPEAAGYGDVLSVGANSNRADALLWEKSSTATVFAGPVGVGDARGNPDYATVSVDYAVDGTLFYVWSDFDSRQIFLRTRPLGGQFGPQRLVTGASPFPAEPDVAVAQFGGVRTIFVFWRESTGQLRYRFSQNDGLNWSATGTVETGVLQEISAYGDAFNTIAVGFTRPGGSSGDLQAYAGFWDGDSFDIERVSPDNSGPFGEPTVARQPDGQLVAVFRGIEENGNYGTYIAGRNENGSWNNSAPFGRLDRGEINSTWLEVDPQGNWHLFWAGSPTRTGRLNVYYAKRPAGQTNFTPAIEAGAGPGSGGIFNVSGALTRNVFTYAHAVYERFDGSNPRLGYSMVNTAAAQAPDADAIVINGGAEFTNQASVRVDFVGVRNTPAQVRYRWGSPPTASDPVVAFANPLTVPLPELSPSEPCRGLALFTQLVGPGGTQDAANAAPIIVDRAVGAAATINSADPGIDRSFARSRNANVNIYTIDECSGLDRATVGGEASGAAITINGAPSANGPVTLSSGDGEKTVNLAVRDRAGNTRTLAVQLTVDTTRPVLTDPGEVEISPGSELSGIAEVELSGVGLSEVNLYGFEIVTVYTPAGGGNAVTGARQVIPAELSGGRASFSYSVASGLPAGSARAGSYELRIRFIDKAGNLSAAATSGQITFAQAPEFPRLFLPYVRK